MKEFGAFAGNRYKKQKVQFSSGIAVQFYASTNIYTLFIVILTKELHADVLEIFLFLMMNLNNDAGISLEMQILMTCSMFNDFTKPFYAKYIVLAPKLFDTTFILTTNNIHMD